MPAVTYPVSWGATCSECGVSSGVVDSEHDAKAWEIAHNSARHGRQVPEGS